jgi:hypothetical protein
VHLLLWLERLQAQLKQHTRLQMLLTGWGMGMIQAAQGTVTPTQDSAQGI